jgi:glycine cleavage system aminomethyltransferase T
MSGGIDDLAPGIAEDQYMVVTAAATAARDLLWLRTISLDASHGRM